MTNTITLKPAPVGMVGLAGHLKRHTISDPGAYTLEQLEAARAVWLEVQRLHGFKGDPKRALLTQPDGNAKLSKGERLLWSLTLSPATSSGLYNTCVRFRDCLSVCVLTSGNGRYNSTQQSRAAKTALLYRAPDAFAILLAHEIDRAALKARKLEAAWGMRLNAASDIPWELAAPWIVQRIARNGGRAYDYSKAWGRTGTPEYRLTLSVDSRQSDEQIRETVRSGRNVAVILPIRKGEPVPTTWIGLPAIDGDVTDARCDDPTGVVVILRAKGQLKGSKGIDHPMVRAL